MDRQETFEINWKEFMRSGYDGRPPERVDPYNLALMFFEIGFSKGVMKDVI